VSLRRVGDAMLAAGFLLGVLVVLFQLARALRRLP